MGDMKNAIKTAAKQVLVAMKAAKATNSQIKAATHEAVWGVMAKEINKMSTAATVAAVMRAKKDGLDSVKAQQAVAKAAQSAALKAKSLGEPWANEAVRNSVPHLKSGLELLELESDSEGENEGQKPTVTMADTLDELGLLQMP